MSQLLPYQPSLASATNTRVDSACKHIQQCRVSTDDMFAFTDGSTETLVREKYKYCVHKDECVIGIGRVWDAAKGRKRTNNAYPRVISNLGNVDGRDVQYKVPAAMLRYMYHYARSMRDRRAIVEFFKDTAYHPPKALRPDYSTTTLNGQEAAFPEDPTKAGYKEDKTATWLPSLNDFIPVGYANTLGWAHPNSGDTMTSVMIGGLRTVMNGDFEIFTGDPIQWYWCFELDCFHPDGRRKEYAGAWERQTDGTGAFTYLPPNVRPDYEITAHVPGHTGFSQAPDAAQRSTYHARQFGQVAPKTKAVARIKPYYRDDDNPRVYDWYRVFAVAISCARPHEMVDIKISRQSM